MIGGAVATVESALKGMTVNELLDDDIGDCGGHKY